MCEHDEDRSCEKSQNGSSPRTSPTLVSPVVRVSHMHELHTMLTCTRVWSLPQRQTWSATYRSFLRTSRKRPHHTDPPPAPSNPIKRFAGHASPTYCKHVEPHPATEV